ncbi:MAG: hypothetical protein HDS79_02295 [Bacteroidales bacterium]|nr:hypothetical protein [Bacteroidales bacterium]
MALFLIILSGLLWLLSFWLLRGRQLGAPVLSFVALVVISLAKSNGYQLLPINLTMLSGWLCMTLVVTFACWLQPAVLRSQSKGWGYMLVGALTGMVVGLLGPSFGAAELSIQNGVMIIATVIGIFLGFLLYTRTPDGRPIAPGSGYFFKYLLAKGFPTAISVMQLGVTLLLVIAVH